MSSVSRAVRKVKRRGFIKVAVDAETKQILSAVILGTGGDEVIHIALDIMYAKARTHEDQCSCLITIEI